MCDDVHCDAAVCVCVCGGGGTYEVEEQRMLLTGERRREPRSHTTLSESTTTFSPTNLHNKHTILSLHIQDTQTYPCVNIIHYSYASCEVLFFVKVDGIYKYSILVIFRENSIKRTKLVKSQTHAIMKGIYNQTTQ